MFGHVVDSGAGKRGGSETLLYHHWVSKRQTWRPGFPFSRAVPANAPDQNRELELKKKKNTHPFCPQPFPHGLSCFHSSCSTSYRPVGHRLGLFFHKASDFGSFPSPLCSQCERWRAAGAAESWGWTQHCIPTWQGKASLELLKLAHL